MTRRLANVCLSVWKVTLPARLASRPDPNAVATPPVLMAFDLMYRDGRDLRARPLRDRRRRLEDLVAGSGLVFPVRRLAADGLEPWAEVVKRQCEGYVAKDESSAYEGGPTRRWLKVKQKGWTHAEDRWRRTSFGSVTTEFLRAARDVERGWSWHG